MKIVKIIRKIRLNGEIVPAGAVIQVVDPEPLLASGYARNLTRVEAQEELEQYVRLVDRLFHGEPDNIRTSIVKGYQERFF